MSRVCLRKGTTAAIMIHTYHELSSSPLPAEPPLPVLISPRPRLPPSSIAAKHLLRILLYRIWRHGALIEQAVLQAEIAAVRRRALNQMAAHSPAWVHFFVA